MPRMLFLAGYFNLAPETIFAGIFHSCVSVENVSCPWNMCPREGELRKANPVNGTRGLKDLLTEEDFLPKAQQDKAEVKA